MPILLNVNNYLTTSRHCRYLVLCLRFSLFNRQMKNLQLSLTKQWFDLTKSGIKTEDYREITPYFAKRFLKYNDKKMSTSFWASLLIGKEFFEMFFDDISFENFD